MAIDEAGIVYVIELKRDRTPRDLIAQLLDYGSWVGGLTANDIANIHTSRPPRNVKSLADAFRDRFSLDLPEILNESHRLIVVAPELDASTERIVEYLSGYGVPINALFFRYFTDGSAEYLARSWLLDPVEAEFNQKRIGTKRTQSPWNGRDFYVPFDESDKRSWDDARRYGFVSGLGAYFDGSLSLLKPGHRVFVSIPRIGYVGVGIVTESVRPVTEFSVDVGGTRMPILDAPLEAPNMNWKKVDYPRDCENVVRVDWLKTFPRDEAYWEKGFFGTSAACRLRQRFTLDKLYERFGVADDM
jgi:hypothetical protein